MSQLDRLVLHEASWGIFLGIVTIIVVNLVYLPRWLKSFRSGISIGEGVFAGTFLGIVIAVLAHLIAIAWSGMLNHWFAHVRTGVLWGALFGGLYGWFGCYVPRVKKPRRAPWLKDQV